MTANKRTYLRYDATIPLAPGLRAASTATQTAGRARDRAADPGAGCGDGVPALELSTRGASAAESGAAPTCGTAPV
jgi:type IV secretory pathway TrbL component